MRRPYTNTMGADGAEQISYREKQLNEAAERRARERELFPALKRFDGLGQAYIDAMGGEDAYRRFILRPNPSAPAYDPKSVIPYETLANCYDYAMNDLDRIGVASGPNNDIVKMDGNKKDFEVFLDDLMNGLRRDGVKLISPDELPQWTQDGLQNGHYLVALYVRPQIMDDAGKTAGFDYHFIRQNSEGAFSHKRGPLEVEYRDNSGDIITDPIKANMGNYVFAGFLAVPENGLDVGEGPRHARPHNQTLPLEERGELDLKSGASLLDLKSVAPLSAAFKATGLTDPREDGLTPMLLAAVLDNNVDAVRALIAGGADANVRGDVEPPVEHKMDLPQIARQRQLDVTPLMLAAASGNKQIASMLLAAGADPTAIRGGKDNEVYQLIKGQISTWPKLEAMYESARNVWNEYLSPDHYALEKQLEPMMPFVQGDDVFDKNNDGFTAASELADTLISAGIASIKDVNNDHYIDADDLLQQWSSAVRPSVENAQPANTAQKPNLPRKP